MLDRLNAEMPAPLTADLVGNQVHISSGVTFTVSDAGGGNTARSLGIITAATGVSDVLGHDLNPRLTPRTRAADLMQGVGISMNASIRIRNGANEALVDLSTAETIEDAINLINGAGVGAWAQISADGNHLDIHNRVSGTDLTVEEAGGNLAAALGIRTIDSDVPLADLNLGLGVTTVDGDDFRVTTANGATHDFDVDGLTTVQDLFDLINADPALTAAFAADGNGIVITDNTAGAGLLRIEALGNSPAWIDLGLNVSATGNQLIGTEVNPTRTEGVFTSLLEIRDALQADDTRALTFAGERLERTMDHMEQVRGEMAAQAKSLDNRATRITTQETFALVLKSDVQDVDITEAVVRFQQVQTALQANMQTASQVMNLSLLDYLR